MAELALLVLQPHYLGSGRESQLCLLIFFIPLRSTGVLSFISHFDYFHQLMMHSYPAPTAYSCRSSPWSPFPLWTPAWVIPSLLPHGKHKFFWLLGSFWLHQQLVSPILPPSVIASLMLLLSERCQLCPPARVFLHALLSGLHMQSVT